MRTIWNSRWSTGPNYSLEEKLKIYKIHPYISLLTLVKFFIWDIIFLTLDVQFESVSYNGIHLFPQARVLSKNVYEHLPQLIIYGPYIICNTNFRNISVVLFQELCLNNVEWWADGKNKRWQHKRGKKWNIPLKVGGLFGCLMLSTNRKPLVSRMNPNWSHLHLQKENWYCTPEAVCEASCIHVTISP